MKRIKVINDPTDLIPVLRALDSDVKQKVFKDVSEKWVTLTEVEKGYGEEGKRALLFFEKMKLVDTMWQAGEGNVQEKAYHSYYMSFHINTSCPIMEISDVLSVAVMSEEDYRSLENKVLEIVGSDGVFAGDVTEKLQLNPTLLKAVVRRSDHLEYKGHRIEPLSEG